MGGYGSANISHPAGLAECSTAGTVADDIERESASLPVESAKIDLSRVLPQELFCMLSTPGYLDLQLSEAEKNALSLPRMCMRSACWKELGRELVRIGLCLVADDECARLWGTNQRHLRAGVFGVEKPDTSKLRLIVDRRRSNATERSLRKGLANLLEGDLIDPERYHLLLRHMTLPHASQFTDLLLPANCHFMMNLLDCKDFFYLFEMPLTAVWTTAVGTPIHRSCFRDMDLASALVKCDLDQDATCSLFLRAPAMGDHKSVEIAQASHTAVLRKAGMGDAEWMSFRSAPTSSRCWMGSYVDDFFQGSVVPAESECHGVRENLLRVSECKLSAVYDSYDEAGFVIKSSKSQLKRMKATVWGGSIDSTHGLVSGSRDKLNRLLLATKRLLERRGRLVQIKIIEQVVGHWVHQLTFQRREST
eukprot:6086479-Amphidinium_carterae.2